MQTTYISEVWHSGTLITLALTMDFSNMWKHCCRFDTFMLLFTQCKCTWLTAISSQCLISLYYLPRYLRSTVTCGKTSATVTWSEPLKFLPCYCYAIKTNSGTSRSQLSQSASAGKLGDMRELQAHHCMTPELCTCLLCNLNVIQANKLSFQELNQLIGIELLTSNFTEILIPHPNFQEGQMPVLPPCGRPCMQQTVGYGKMCLSQH